MLKKAEDTGSRDVFVAVLGNVKLGNRRGSPGQTLRRLGLRTNLVPPTWNEPFGHTGRNLVDVLLEILGNGIFFRSHGTFTCPCVLINIVCGVKKLFQLGDGGMELSALKVGGTRNLIQISCNPVDRKEIRRITGKHSLSLPVRRRSRDPGSLHFVIIRCYRSR
jgi:hypothetical protein